MSSSGHSTRLNEKNINLAEALELLQYVLAAAAGNGLKAFKSSLDKESKKGELAEFCKNILGRIVEKENPDVSIQVAFRIVATLCYVYHIPLDKVRASDGKRKSFTFLDLAEDYGNRSILKILKQRDINVLLKIKPDSYQAMSSLRTQDFAPPSKPSFNLQDIYANSSVNALFPIPLSAQEKQVAQQFLDIMLERALDLNFSLNTITQLIATCCVQLNIPLRNIKTIAHNLNLLELARDRKDTAAINFLTKLDLLPVLQCESPAAAGVDMDVKDDNPHHASDQSSHSSRENSRGKKRPAPTNNGEGSGHKKSGKEDKTGEEHQDAFTTPKKKKQRGVQSSTTAVQVSSELPDADMSHLTRTPSKPHQAQSPTHPAEMKIDESLFTAAEKRLLSLTHKQLIADLNLFGEKIRIDPSQLQDCPYGSGYIKNYAIHLAFPESIYSAKNAGDFYCKFNYADKLTTATGETIKVKNAIGGIVQLRIKEKLPARILETHPDYCVSDIIQLTAVHYTQLNEDLLRLAKQNGGLAVVRVVTVSVGDEIGCHIRCAIARNTEQCKDVTFSDTQRITPTVTLPVAFTNLADDTDFVKSSKTQSYEGVIGPIVFYYLENPKRLENIPILFPPRPLSAIERLDSPEPKAHPTPAPSQAVPLTQTQPSSATTLFFTSEKESLWTPSPAAAPRPLGVLSVPQPMTPAPA